MRRKEPAAPVREPHPDPRIEAQLQRILSIRTMITGKEALVARDRDEIARMRATMAKHPNREGHHRRREQIEALQAEIADAEAEVLKLHDDIEARLGEIADADLTAL